MGSITDPKIGGNEKTENCANHLKNEGVELGSKLSEASQIGASCKKQIRFAWQTWTYLLYYWLSNG